MKKTKYVILGDSISEGIGSKMINYESFLKEKLGEDFIISNLAHTGTTIEYANEIYDKIKNEKPDYVIIFYGNVDAQVRANIWGKKHNINRFIPKRYKKNGMLDPRPFYSKKWYRFLPDRIDNLNRFILKKIVLKFEGKTQWVQIDKFEYEYTRFIENLKKDGIKPIIISTTYLDDKYFLNSNEEYEKYNYCLKRISEKYKCKYIDLYNRLKKQVKDEGSFKRLYSYDHFHPNLCGYEYIAEIIYKEIM